MGISKLELHTQANDSAIAPIFSAPIADCEDDGVILLKFVRALAKRQARLDVGLSFDAANDNATRTLH